MKVFDWIELGCLNIFGGSVIIWMNTFIGSWSTIMAMLVGASVLVLNIVKIYGVHLDNQIKRKKLNE